MKMILQNLHTTHPYPEIETYDENKTNFSI